MSMRHIIVVCTVLVAFCCKAQSEFSYLTIPKDLTKQANAVIRKDSTSVEVTGVNKMRVYSEFTITVLNELGSKYAQAVEFYDKNTRVKNQEAYIYDGFGNQIEKFKRGDFEDISAISSGDLYTDNRYKYLEYTPTEYPYTLHYISEVETTETAFIQPWFPVPGRYIGVEQSIYNFKNLAGIPFRHKEVNFDGYDIEKQVSESGILYSFSNIQAIPDEELSPNLEYLVPGVRIALNRFSLVNVTGEADNWKDFGKWQHENLISGLDELPQSTRDEISKLVAGVPNEKEKVKLIYDYVQNKTRYISVQLGIGGWKPYPASDVDKLGYGDCKGLTNYTKALLASQGINAYYSVVHAGSSKKNIESDFAAMQGNHVILNVPLEGEEIWLECTSQTMPFNFLGDFTDDRDVLVVGEGGGEIKRTPAYLNEDNLQSSKGTFMVSEDGAFSGTVEIRSLGYQYDRAFVLEDMDNSERDKHFKSYWDSHKELNIREAVLNNDRDSIVFTQKVTMSSENYVSFVNEKFIFRPNAFNANNYIPKKYKNRRHPFILNRGYKDVDQYTFTVPEGYTPDFLPEPVELETKFGKYSASVVAGEGSEYHYYRELIIFDGIFPADEYESYRAFRRKIKKNDNTKVVFVKTQ